MKKLIRLSVEIRLKVVYKILWMREVLVAKQNSSKAILLLSNGYLNWRIKQNSEFDYNTINGEELAQITSCLKSQIAWIFLNKFNLKLKFINVLNDRLYITKHELDDCCLFLSKTLEWFDQLIYIGEVKVRYYILHNSERFYIHLIFEFR